MTMGFLFTTKESVMNQALKKTEAKNEDRPTPWNKGKLVGQKPPLKLKEIWAIRIRPQLADRTRELALLTDVHLRKRSNLLI
jgi:hypothetical protein